MTEFDRRISALARAAAASLRGARIDTQWLYDEALQMLGENPSAKISKVITHTLVDVARALLDAGEYALGGEIFEELLKHAQTVRYHKLEFEALGALAQTWYFLGDIQRSDKIIETAINLALQLKRPRQERRFIQLRALLRSPSSRFTSPRELKAPTQQSLITRRRNSHASSLLKKLDNTY